MKIKAENIIEFLHCLDKVYGQEIFRGQGNREWPVLPTLGRLHSGIEKSKGLGRSWLEF